MWADSEWGVPVNQEPVGNDLGDHLDSEDVEVDPLAHVDKGGLGRAARVEWRFPCHRDAVADDRAQDERIEWPRLNEANRPASGWVGRPEVAQGLARVDAATGTLDLSRLRHGI